MYPSYSGQRVIEESNKSRTDLKTRYKGSLIPLFHQDSLRTSSEPVPNFKPTRPTKTLWVPFLKKQETGMDAVVCEKDLTASLRCGPHRCLSSWSAEEISTFWHSRLGPQRQAQQETGALNLATAMLEAMVDYMLQSSTDPAKFYFSDVSPYCQPVMHFSAA